jgi:hypothetical protein
MGIKIRNSFVSNSSSSSFICEICNHTESGWDASVEDIGFVRCENDHTFCEEHLLEGSEYDDANEVPENVCPICNFSEPSYPELKRYFTKETNISEDTVFQEVKKVNKRRRVLRDHEYVEYVLREKNTTIDILLNELKEKFETYSKFKEYYRSK